MKYILSIVFTFSIFQLSAQTADFPYLPYYQLINKAELNIAKEDFKNALQEYQNAFESVEYPFAKDYYNAALVAAVVKDKKTTIGYLEELIQLGVSFHHLDSLATFSKIRKTKHWRNFKASIPTLEAEFQENINQELRKKILLLTERHTAYRSYVGYFNNMPRLDTVHTEIANEFFEIMEEYGLPSEQLLGVSEIVTSPFYYTILANHCDKRSYDYDRRNLEPVLVAALKAGKIRPQVAVNLIGMQKERFKPRYKIDIYTELKGGKFELVLETPKSDFEQIDKNRTVYGLSTIEEYQIKAAYRIKKLKTDFRLPFPDIREIY